MASEQLVLFTVMPRGVTLDGADRPVSIFVTPRLTGEPTLAAFPDWRNWTTRVRDNGLSVTLRCGAATRTVTLDPAPLRPALWNALFADDTLVDSYTFDDYSQRGLITYSVRRALSALKAIYQQAAITLALPEPSLGDRGSPLRAALGAMVNGLAVYWGPGHDAELRDRLRIIGIGGVAEQSIGTDPATLDSEGLIVGAPNPTANRAAALPFAVFHHMPTPSRTPLAPDWKTALDFHKALSAVNAYPLLQRALGLAFDLDLPAEFVAATSPTAPGTIAVTGAELGTGWSVPTTVPDLATAYVSLASGGKTLFLTAPRALADPSAPTTVIGLLVLEPGRFGLAQVDVDGAMHKAIILAETVSPDPEANLASDGPASAQHPEVFDPEATLPSMRSGGFTLYADGRALALLDTIAQAGAFNNAVAANGAQPRPFYAEDLVRGFRLDIWDSRTNLWHSLHRRIGTYRIADQTFGPAEDEGFVQLAVAQPAPGAQPATNDIYVHEAIARWPGWSLSAPRPGKHLSRYADPDKAIPPDTSDPEYAENQPVTPFKLVAGFKAAPASLPQLRFGRRYRLRARAVDLAGNSMALANPLTDQLAALFALPQDPEGFAYLRFEPVAAPLVVIRDPKAVTGLGSAVDRLVIRTFNDGADHDADAADLTAGDRHILPPRASVEICEHLGLFDDASGHLKGDAATWTIIGNRDAGELPHVSVTVAGKTSDMPLIAGAEFDALPYLPDTLSRGAALRDLPGSGQGVRAIVTPGAGADAPVAYVSLHDPNPRPGSATIVRFGESGDWQTLAGFRLRLAEPPAHAASTPPHWDAQSRTLTVYLAKAGIATVPLSSYLLPADLALMGQWQWLRQFIERQSINNPQAEVLLPGGADDRTAHVLQRAEEGGHWMLTPPRLLTLVHAVQQPLGGPAFRASDIAHIPGNEDATPLQTAPIAGRTDPTELAPVTAWRLPGSTDAFLIGSLHVHGASTAKIDITARWEEPVDAPPAAPTTASHSAHVEELKLDSRAEGYIPAAAQDPRQVGFYTPVHDLILFVRAGDTLGVPGPNQQSLGNAAPRHVFGDGKHRRVRYTATATSRFREYFDPSLPATRASVPVTVDVPASVRPLAPDVRFVIPTFGWERSLDGNIKRSVRFGGGLRVYLGRPWFSSGVDELLGVALWSAANGEFDADRFKPFVTRWGMDPIWTSADLLALPSAGNIVGGSVPEIGLSLQEPAAAAPDGSPGLIDVVGYSPEFDDERGLWFADITIDTFSETYSPFVRLALVRYQQHALPDAKVSRVVLADFAQLPSDRALLVSSDPFHPRTLRVVVSGVAPRGPAPVSLAQPPASGPVPAPTEIRLRVQRRNPHFAGDLAWGDAQAADATIAVNQSGAPFSDPDLALFVATVTFAAPPPNDTFRLVVEEFEYVSADYTAPGGGWPGRLVFAEIIPIDAGDGET